MSVTASGQGTRPAATSRSGDLSILQVCRGRDWSGGENIVLTLAAGLRRRGHDSRVLTFGSGMLARELEVAGVPAEALGHRSRAHPRGVLQLWRTLRERQPDVVHSHGASAMVIANPLARLAGVPAVITTFHHMAGPGRVITNQRLHGLYYRLEGLVGRWATDICVCYAEPARWDAIAVRGVPADRVAVVDNGIDLRRFTPLEGPDRRKARAAARDRLGLPPGSFVVGAVGRMIPAKGHEHLIAAFARMRSGRPDAVLVIVGDGPLADRVRGQIRSLGLEGVTFLPGTLPVTPELYGAFDVFVYPSVVGVFGLVVLEAMACGVPVVASSLPGSEILLADGVDALTIPPGDPAAIAGAVLRLANDQELANELAARGADHVRRHFSADTMVDRYLALYRAVLARQPAQPISELPVLRDR